MTIEFITTAVKTLMPTLLMKGSEKAAETIGEKIGEKASTKSFWKTVKSLFVIEIEEQRITTIENKPTATSQELKMIQDKVITKIQTNADFAAEIEASFSLSSNDIFIAEQLLKSIAKDEEALEYLFEERRDASIDAEGSYENMIRRTRRRLEKDKKEFVKLIVKK